MIRNSISGAKILVTLLIHYDVSMSDTAPPPSGPNDAALHAAPLQHRIVQHRGRRYSIKLEPEFWTWLEGLAAMRGMRLNSLVADVAARLPTSVNLASGLRQFCMSEAGQRIVRLEDRVVDLSLAGGHTNLAVIIEACPAPTILIAGNHEILRVNGAFARWSGIARGDLIGRMYDHVFSLATAAPLHEVWDQFARGYPRPIPAKLTYLAPGRVVVAKTALCAASVKSREAFTVLAMIDVTW